MRLVQQKLSHNQDISLFVWDLTTKYFSLLSPKICNAFIRHKFAWCILDSWLMHWFCRSCTNTLKSRDTLKSLTSMQIKPAFEGVLHKTGYHCEYLEFKTHFPFLSHWISITFIAPVNIPFIFLRIFTEIKWKRGTISFIENSNECFLFLATLLTHH